jgi:hypothetical protein
VPATSMGKLFVVFFPRKSVKISFDLLFFSKFFYLAISSCEMNGILHFSVLQIEFIWVVYALLKNDAKKSLSNFNLTLLNIYQFKLPIR